MIDRSKRVSTLQRIAKGLMVVAAVGFFVLSLVLGPRRGIVLSIAIGGVGFVFDGVAMVADPSATVGRRFGGSLSGWTVRTEQQARLYGWFTVVCGAVLSILPLLMGVSAGVF